MKVEINVADEHIEKGKAGDCRLCPISLAIKPLLKFNVPLEVTCYRIWLGVENRTVSLPLLARDFIRAFDSRQASKKPKPVTFTLDIPDQYLKEAA